MVRFRTDIAAESQRKHGSRLNGVRLEKHVLFGIRAERVVISNAESAEILNKPQGTYTTLDLSSLSDGGTSALQNCAFAVAETVSAFLPSTSNNEPILAVGLGNRNITSDSFGPNCADKIIATRHLANEPDVTPNVLRSVAVLSPGVLGSTGIESGENISAVARALRPCACILIDALASSDHSTLCKNVQISNTGIAPGSGVANHRFEISQKTIGVPCISVGIPTVVEAKTLVSAFAQSNGLSEEVFSFDAEDDSFYLTPKDIDRLSNLCVRAVSFGLNIALQPDLSTKDIEELLS